MATSKASEIRLSNERVVPVRSVSDLSTDHVAQYRFAALFANGNRVWDVGCGTGQGTEILASTAETVFGCDTSEEAIRYAGGAFSGQFCVADANSLPAATDSVDLVTAFQVIERAADWRGLVEEASRILSLGGVFLVAITNANDDGERLRNFEHEELKEELSRCFPFVAIVGQGRKTRYALAVCSKKSTQIPAFTFAASGVNAARDRENHAGVHRRLNARPGFLNHPTRERDLEIFRGAEQSWKLQAEVGDLLARVAELEEELEAVKRSFWLRIGFFLDFGPWTEGRFHLKRVGRWLGRLVQGFTLWFSHWISDPCLAAWTVVWRAVCHLSNLVVVLFLLVASALLFAVEDVCFSLFGKRQLPAAVKVAKTSASVVIANWNGRALLESFLPSVVAGLSSDRNNEIIVVDNGSADGSAELIRDKFPSVRVLDMERNLGFGRGSNAGVRAAKNDVVVLLNNDMEVDPDFLAPLLKPFEDPLVFAVSSQIFLTDSTKQRAESGLTEVRWENGFYKPSHRIDPEIKVPYPCAYPGGGSSAFDRSKLMELGGFDPLFEPFYYEDTDLGFLAWKRGWKVLYQPASVVHHCHRATVGKSYSETFIQGVLNKNSILYCWKNIHNWKMLAHHLMMCFVNCIPQRRQSPSQVGSEDVKRAFSHIRGAIRSRWVALSKAAVSDREAMNRTQGGYFRDRFVAGLSPVPARLKVLFVSPFPMEPPTHGGGVFMKQTLAQLTNLADVHLVSFLDNEHQLQSQQPLLQMCKSAHFVVRPIISRVFWTLIPFPVRQFSNRDFKWLIDRTLFLEEIDVVQLEYTMLGQYAEKYRHIPSLLFEHDISTQSLKRALSRTKVTFELLLEYFRMRLYEPRTLSKVARVQVCSRANAEYLRVLAPKLKKVDSNMRAAIDMDSYRAICERNANTILFVGGFNHKPNLEGLRWFITQVFDRVLEKRPDTILEIVGSNPPDPCIWRSNPSIRLIGPVPDVRPPLQRAAVFICPILVGSGIRVKLLEAFASRIAVVSTSIGAEGLASKSGEVCEIADTPETFAESILLLLGDDSYRTALADRARKMVESNYDARAAVARLEHSYRSEVSALRVTEKGVGLSARA